MNWTKRGSEGVHSGECGFELGLVRRQVRRRFEVREGIESLEGRSEGEKRERGEQLFMSSLLRFIRRRDEESEGGRGMRWLSGKKGSVRKRGGNGEGASLLISPFTDDE